uniref:Uncharacterized protein n=1 Tax=Lactuca sativa TaxID=4236 RepID=A0A9R1XD19_LACSA|nr:hypothetical protein LSAT_V11C500271030 [Lactuca sativa]
MSLQASRSNPKGISDILIPSFNQVRIVKSFDPQTTLLLIMELQLFPELHQQWRCYYGLIIELYKSIWNITLQANKIGKINLVATGKDLMDDEKQGDVLLLFAGAVSSGQEDSGLQGPLSFLTLEFGLVCDALLEERKTKDHSLTKFSSLYQNGQGHKLENTGGTTGHHPSDSSATKLPSNARGLPSPVALAVVMRHAQRLLSGPAVHSLTGQITIGLECPKPSTIGLECHHTMGPIILGMVYPRPTTIGLECLHTMSPIILGMEYSRHTTIGLECPGILALSQSRKASTIN